MLMGIVWTGMIAVSILYSCAAGTTAALWSRTGRDGKGVL